MHLFKTALAAAAVVSQAQAALKTFRFSLSEGNVAPDGFSRKYTLINGATPGPVIEVNQGDDVEVIVTNTVAENATVHFHGIEMFRTPWNDGVPGVSQRPIKKGETYTYRWSATQYGSYWYHSHYRGQIEDGLYGAIIIHPRSTVANPFSKISSSEVAALTAAEAVRKPLIVSDITHLHSHDKWDAVVEAGIEVFCYDSVVFNGKGNVNCLNTNQAEAALTSAQRGLLDVIPNSHLTDKACIPPQNINKAFNGDGDASRFPAGIFSGCKATTGSREVVRANANSWVAFDVIGANNFILAVFSIDKLDMWVYAVDGNYVNPQKVQAFELFNGDRISIMVKTGAAGSYNMRVHAATLPQILIGHSILAVGGATPSTAPLDLTNSYITLPGGPINSNVKFLDHKAATQFTPDVIPKTADSFFRFTMEADSSWQWALNITRLDPQAIDSTPRPVLFAPDRNEATVDNPVFVTTKNNTWVDFVFIASNATPMPPHPVHKHGNKMYHLGSGTGAWTWKSVNDAIAANPSAFNLVNPPKVDAVMTPGVDPANNLPTWTAIRYHVTDPGAWALHCHIHNHVEGGMLAVIQDGIDKWPTIPQEYWNILDS